LQKAVELSGRAPVTVANLGIAYGRQGKIKEAEAIASGLLKASKDNYIPEFNMACLYGAIGRKDEAFQWLEKCYRERCNGLSAMRVYPLANDLISDPRFTELLHRMKLD